MVVLGFFLGDSSISWALLHKVLMACFTQGAYTQLCMVSTVGQQEKERSRRWDSTLTEHPCPHPTLGWEGGGEHSAPL